MSISIFLKQSRRPVHYTTKNPNSKPWY